MSTLIIEKAKLKNLKDLIYLLFDDDLGKDRENISETSFNNYKKSFMKILNDTNNEIITPKTKQIRTDHERFCICFPISNALIKISPKKKDQSAMGWWVSRY